MDYMRIIEDFKLSRRKFKELKELKRNYLPNSPEAIKANFLIESLNISEKYLDVDLIGTTSSQLPIEQLHRLVEIPVEFENENDNSFLKQLADDLLKDSYFKLKIIDAKILTE